MTFSRRSIFFVVLLAGGASLRFSGAPGMAAVPPASPPAPAARKVEKTEGLTPELLEYLKKVAQTYQAAASYRDEGRVVIVQQSGKVKLTTEAPMTVAFQRPNRLHLDAGQYEAVCDGRTLIFSVPSQRQFTRGPAPPAIERKNLPSGSVLGGTDDGQPELLDLLIRADAIETMLGSVTKIGWKTDAVVAGRPCRVIAYDTNQGTHMTLYFDAERQVLLKAEGNYEGTGEAGEAPAVDRLRLNYELAPVELNRALPAETFAVKEPTGYQRMLSIGGEPAPPEKDSNKTPDGAHLIGKPLPPIDGKDLAGRAFDADAIRGKVILVFFWSAAGSEHSLTSIVLVQQLADRFKDRSDFTVLAVNTDAEPLPLAAEMLERKKATFRSLTDESRSLRRGFGLAGVPTFLVADRNGIVQWAKLGAPPSLKNELTAEIEKRLASK